MNILTQVSLLLLAAGAALVFLARSAAEIPQTQLEIGWLASIAGTVLAYIRFRKWAMRQYARRAIRRTKFPPLWQVSFGPDPTVESADVFLTGPDGSVRYAVAIARWKGVAVTRTLITRQQKLVDQKGKRMRAGRIRDLTDQCATAKWYPVLWLPTARSAAAMVLDDGLLIIQGGAHELRAAVAPRES